MSRKVLMKGNEAIGEAAISAGCRYFFGYPITPQSELPAFLARRMREVGGVFLQAESEIAAINMVYGAASSGARAMTSSSSPGVSLKQEGISYLCGSELPCLVVNVMRGGPGLGTIQPSQSDYFQAVKGGGHGDYRTFVLAPSSVQEIVDHVRLAFEVADKYRNPSVLLADGTLGQMMEPAELGEYRPDIPEKPWATTGCAGRPPNIITSIYIQPEVLEKHNEKLQAKYAKMREAEQRAEEWMMEDAEVMVAAYGTVARIAKTAIRRARAEGVRVGLLRPVSLWPFPVKFFERWCSVRRIITVELSSGQMVEDVRLAVRDRVPVDFFGRLGGMVPSVEEVFREIMKTAGASVESCVR
jgi:2-oxoglutarate ferredoxin oxidoreductase subunit alpha